MYVYLNAGHNIGVAGQPDPGAVGPGGLTEAEVTLDVARRAAHLLRARGVTTNPVQAEALTRAVERANASHATLFVSLHCNAAGDANAGGVEVWRHHPDSQPLANDILSEILQQVAGQRGQWFTRPLPLRNRGVKAGEFYVLTRTKMPAVLVELAFISNPREERWLRTPRIRQAFAQAIADGVARAAPE